MGSVMRIAKLAAAIAAVSLLAGCTTVTAGNATKDPSFKPGDAIVSLLNPGNYPTAPKPGPALKPGAETGRIFDGERMGDYVVGPWEVDSQLLDADITATGLLLSVHSVFHANTEVANKHHFIYGFGSTRGTPQGADHPRSIQNAVLRFPDPAEAAAAAADFYMQDPFRQLSSSNPDVSVPGHPETRAFQFTTADGAFATKALTVHGPLLLVQGTSSQQSADVSLQLAAKTLDLQTSRIDAFRPTDPSQFATMQIDPDGLLRRVVPTKDGTFNQGLWGPHAILHFDSDPLKTAPALAEAGVDQVAVRGAYVYQTRDAAAATQLTAKLLELAKEGNEPGPSVPGLPAATCVMIPVDMLHTKIAKCFAAVGRWTFHAYSIQPFDATQRMASQYLLLTAK